MADVHAYCPIPSIADPDGYLASLANANDNRDAHPDRYGDGHGHLHPPAYRDPVADGYPRADLAYCHAGTR